MTEMLDFLKHLKGMILEGATGFELAYEVEKYPQFKNKLMHDGIIFYNNFVEIGNSIFIEMPDRRKVNYQTFKTIEETEKFIFMMWLDEMIASLEHKPSIQEQFRMFKQTRQLKKVTHCKGCGAKFSNDSQKICEVCGSFRQNY